MNGYKQPFLTSHNMIMLLVMGDMNVKVESNNNDRESGMGSQGCGTINNNGDRLVNLCLNNKCAIGGTIFQHKYIHKLTWRAPNGQTMNQIDNVVINNKWKRSLNDVHTYSCADVRSDLYLVMCNNIVDSFSLLIGQATFVRPLYFVGKMILSQPLEKAMDHF